jgi:hypothetical protein
MVKQNLKGSIMLTFETHGQEINRLHLLAQQTASDAIEYARTAGMLLLEVKKGMKHGKFLLWVRDNAQVSLRQAQRYMAVAQGKTIPLRRLIEKSDTVSNLKMETQCSEGVWVKGVWEPEPGFMYLFNDDTGAYWVTPSSERAESFHVCKHYNGEKISSKDFYWRYTIFAFVEDPDLTSEFYIGTRWPLTLRSGVAGVLESYGLKDLKESLQMGSRWVDGSERPFCEPPKSNWYWDSEKPEGYGLFQVLENKGYLNANGAITFLG